MNQDNYTVQVLETQLAEWENAIYDIEERIEALSDNVPALVEYLKTQQYSMTLGLGLRRNLCDRFATEQDNTILLRFPDGRERTVKNYKADGYNILTDDIKTYADLCIALNWAYNGDSLAGAFPRAEFNRLLRATSNCTRQKLFLLSFALHMDTEQTSWFLQTVLGEQTYNPRKAEEIITFYCRSHEQANHYKEYCALLRRYRDEIEILPHTAQQQEQYTIYARFRMQSAMNNEDELMNFLESNRINFYGFSNTAYKEFMRLYEIARGGVIHAPEDCEVFSVRQKAYQNTEQLAKDMISFVPRYTHEYERDGKKIVENEYISIYNGENGQKSKKIQTTTLPKGITRKLMVRDRLDDLISKKIPIERKDLVFMKFFVFYRIAEKEAYTARDYSTFMEECNAMLSRCGMAHLYPGNRFENLIMLSMVAENPFEMFENIIDATFMNEPGAISEEA